MDLRLHVHERNRIRDAVGQLTRTRTRGRTRGPALEHDPHAASCRLRGPAHLAQPKRRLQRREPRRERPVRIAERLRSRHRGAPRRHVDRRVHDRPRQRQGQLRADLVDVGIEPFACARGRRAHRGKRRAGLPGRQARHGGRHSLGRRRRCRHRERNAPQPLGRGPPPLEPCEIEILAASSCACRESMGRTHTTRPSRERRVAERSRTERGKLLLRGAEIVVVDGRVQRVAKRGGRGVGVGARCYEHCCAKARPRRRDQRGNAARGEPCLDHGRERDRDLGIVLATERAARGHRDRDGTRGIALAYDEYHRRAVLREAHVGRTLAATRRGLWRDGESRRSTPDGVGGDHGGYRERASLQGPDLRA